MAARSALLKDSYGDIHGAGISAGRTESLQQRLQAALERLGDGYVPRTHHVDDKGNPKYVNRLVEQASPYLLQHAHNPVDWFPWSDEAFELAKLLNRPIFLSIGYATCHWCHVMEEESFDNEEIAALLNEHFIAIKVDREERPDIDSVYMQAVQMMTGQGGWPMTVVMTPEGKPFFGGTYFPPVDNHQYGRRGMKSLLPALAEAYRNKRDELLKNADAMVASLQQQFATLAVTEASASSIPTTAHTKAAAELLLQQFDSVYGGIGGPPKFPQPPILSMLLHSGDAEARDAVLFTLDKIAAGGIRDHIGGGFHRYSVDDRWLVPHFEKMLYDNALLAQLYLDAYAMTGQQRYADVAVDTIDFLMQAFWSDEGGFVSAFDADSEGEEGTFYVFDPTDLREILTPDEFDVAVAYYGVTEAGNFEAGKSVLSVVTDTATVARQLGITDAQAQERLKFAKQKIRAARAKRPHPIVDNKIITADNGYAIGALADAVWLLPSDRYDKAVEVLTTKLLRNMHPQETLQRSFVNGRSSGRAFADDYAALIDGLLRLQRATGDMRWYGTAVEAQREFDRDFWDEEGGGYFRVAKTEPQLLAKQKPGRSGVVPAANALAAKNLLDLYRLTGDKAYEDKFFRLFAMAQTVIERDPYGAATWYEVAERFRAGIATIIIVVKENRDEADPYMAQINQARLRNTAVVVISENLPDEKRPAAWKNKKAVDGKATAYVCKDFVCQFPTNEIKAFAAQIEQLGLE